MDCITAKAVRNLYPLNRLSQEALGELLPAMRERWFSRGFEIFDFGENPDDYCYVLEGSVWLADCKEEHIQAIGDATEAECIPLPYVLPTIHRARASTDVKVLLVDRTRLNEVVGKYKAAGMNELNWTQRAETAAAITWEDWQSAMLRAPGFLRIPTDNMRRALTAMQPVECRRGDVVIHQGAVADHFYVIAEGRCEILRACLNRAEPVRVAECGVGDTLGEDALISGNVRNATVRMLTDGRLMRLDGDDFRFLIKRSMVHQLDFHQARDLVARGGRWIDIRLPSERTASPLTDAITIPHLAARALPFKGDPYCSYVVACSKGMDAPAVAFALCKDGYDAYCLRGGLAVASH